MPGPELAAHLPSLPAALHPRTKPAAAPRGLRPFRDPTRPPFPLAGQASGASVKTPAAARDPRAQHAAQPRGPISGCRRLPPGSAQRSDSRPPPRTAQRPPKRPVRPTRIPAVGHRARGRGRRPERTRLAATPTSRPRRAVLRSPPPAAATDTPWP
ncbi:uncharacterized protein DKFZp434B061-like [Nannospalax galili]|uniref:uncharacterized protein DKFZp434B061-like n=1 Tax=Nannospalax galili TaxID=1026970 RepID=UPI00111C2137|nr:uncharacterized protein DKFZp434B061-like [Nannospalax galili]